MLVDAPTVVGPEQLIMGSAGNWQTKDGIVVNEEDRAVATLLAAMRSGIVDFDTAPLCAPARHLNQPLLHDPFIPVAVT